MTSIVRLARCAFLGFALSGCMGGTDEVARAASPNGRYEAVLLESSGGATTSMGYRVFVVPPGTGPRQGTEVASLYGTVRSDSAYGINLRWDDATTLSLEFQDSQRDTLLAPVVRIGGHRVHVRFRRGVTDSTAPSGSMWYNQAGRPHDAPLKAAPAEDTSAGVPR